MCPARCWTSCGRCQWHCWRWPRGLRPMRRRAHGRGSAHDRADADRGDRGASRCWWSRRFSRSRPGGWTGSGCAGAGERPRCPHLPRERPDAAPRAPEAFTDSLSGLGNRRALMDDLEQAVTRRTPDGWTLVFLDLNGFKRYNDSFGHAAGDALLARIGGGWARRSASHGRAYRLGGDEFCVLLNGRYARHDPLIAAAAAALSGTRQCLHRHRLGRIVVLPEEARRPARRCSWPTSGCTPRRRPPAAAVPRRVTC